MFENWHEILTNVTSMAGNITWRPRYALYGCVKNALKQTCDSQYVSSCACGG